MNILYISSKKKWGGVSSWMLKTATRLTQKGHTVWIIAHPNGQFAKSADSENLKLVKKRLGMDYNPLMVYFLVRFIKKHRIDLMVTNIEKEVIIGGLAARFCGIPNIRRVGREDDFNEKLKVKLHHRLFVDHSIVPCNYVRDRSIGRAPFLDKDEFTTIYNGRNPNTIDPNAIQEKRRAWQIPEGALIVGVTSQLSSVKRIDGILHAFRALLKKYTYLYLVIVGKGLEKENLIQMSNELGLSSHVIFAGFSNDPMLCAASFDISVSNAEFEGFPNTVVEYFAAGSAVVTTNAGGVSEMAEDGQNALVIPVGAVDRLEAAISRLIESETERKRLGDNARKTVSKGFSEDAMIQSLEETYLSILKRD